MAAEEEALGAIALSTTLSQVPQTEHLPIHFGNEAPQDVHSYLILAYSEHEKVSLNVGFYYMANAGGRLAGTVLSGWIYQTQGLEGCLWWSTGFVLAAALLSIRLPEVAKEHV